MNYPARCAQLQADVARHKAAIRTHRQQLGAAAAALAHLEAECRRLGISLVRQTTHGAEEGDLHGRPDRSAP